MNRKGKILSSSTLLINTLLGVSVVGSAYGFSQVGFLLGTFLFVLFALLSGFGLFLLSKSALSIGIFPSSFYTVGEVNFPQCTVAIDFAVALKCLGVATSFLIVIGDLLPDIAKGFKLELSNRFLLSRHFWITVSMAYLSPLALQKSLNALRYSTAFATSCALTLVVIILYYSISSDNHICGDDKSIVVHRAVGTPIDILRVLSIFVFAFTCHQNIFSVCNELRNPSSYRIGAVIAISVSFALAVHLTLSWGAYVVCGTNVSDNLLNNYPHGILLTLARLCVALLVSCGYPLQIHPCRTSIVNIILWMKRNRRWSLFPHTNDASKSSPLEMNLNQKQWSPERRASIQIERFESVLHNDVASLGFPCNQEQKEELLMREHDTTGNRSTQSVSPKRIYKSDQVISKSLHCVISAVVLLITYSIAMTVSDLGVVLEVIGATGSTIISYIFPGLIFLSLHPKSDPLWYPALLQFMLGCCFMPLCLFFILWGVLK